LKEKTYIQDDDWRLAEEGNRGNVQISHDDNGWSAVDWNYIISARF
jgi:hypothetical protein